MAPRIALHPRNQHRDGYDFARLTQICPELASVTVTNPLGRPTIDFADPASVRILNRALLLSHYDLRFWEIPPAYLCPPIPGRVDYVHYLADLLAESNRGKIPHGPEIRVLDIGTGASLIYPLTGQAEYGWAFTGTDIDPVSIRSAERIRDENGLSIALRLQPDPENIFTGVIRPGERFHLTMCNPPFHASAEDAASGTMRKWRNLGKAGNQELNFGGQSAELWCPGGEVGFISRMIAESRRFAEDCLWFTSLVSRADSLRPLIRQLSRTGIDAYRVVEMGQGQKTSRFLAWTYYPPRQRTL